MTTKHLPSKVLAMLPTYNEAGNIQALIAELLALDPLVEVLTVDDQSPDGTGKLVAQLAEQNPRIHLINRLPPRGRGLAGREGFTWFQQHPQFEVLVEMDADFSHHPRFLPGLVQALVAGADVALGSRYTAGGAELGRGASRQWTSKLANAYLRLVFRTKIRDCTTGYRAYTQAALAGIDFTQYRSVNPTIVGEVLFDLICNRRRIVEVPILFEDRRWGESKLSLQVLLNSLWFPLMLRWQRLSNPPPRQRTVVRPDLRCASCVATANTKEKPDQCG